MPGTDSLLLETTFADNISGVELHDYRFSESLADSTGYHAYIRVKAAAKTTIAIPGESRIKLIANAGNGAVFQNWSIGLLVLVLGLLASVRISRERYFTQLFQSSVNQKAANRLYHERVYNFLDVAYRLDFLFYCAFGLLIFHLLRLLIPSYTIPGYLLFFICTAAIAAYYILKHSFYRITGHIFDVRSEMGEFVFYQKLGNRMAGVFLIPISFLLYLIKGEMDWVLIAIGGFIVLLFSAVSLLRGAWVVTKKVFSIYYLFLYLCTLEILPLVLVWRILWRVQ
jgi:hypothetical protein